MPKLQDLQLHHLIPQSLMEEFGTHFKNAGLSVDDGFNLKYLEKGFHGNHPQYSGRVAEKLREFINQNGSLTEQNIRELAKDMRALVNEAYHDWKNLSGPNLNEAFR